MKDFRCINCANAVPTGNPPWICHHYRTDRRSVLEKSKLPPDITGLLEGELIDGVACACGHRLIRPNTRQSWYWTIHGPTKCELELPDLVCWCGLKRSEHVRGHNDSRECILEVRDLLPSLSPDDRVQLFRSISTGYCASCGDAITGICHCENDE